MAEHVRPPGVFTVDAYSGRPPPVPPRTGRRAQKPRAAQKLLFLLVAAALCGLVIEAFCILQLHQKMVAVSVCAGWELHHLLRFCSTVASPQLAKGHLGLSW